MIEQEGPDDAGSVLHSVGMTKLGVGVRSNWLKADFIRLTGHLPEMCLSCRVFELKVAEERVWRFCSLDYVYGRWGCPLYIHPGQAEFKSELSREEAW